MHGLKRDKKDEEDGKYYFMAYKHFNHVKYSSFALNSESPNSKIWFCRLSVVNKNYT